MMDDRKEITVGQKVFYPYHAGIDTCPEIHEGTVIKLGPKYAEVQMAGFSSAYDLKELFATRAGVIAAMKESARMERDDMIEEAKYNFDRFTRELDALAGEAHK